MIKVSEFGEVIRFDLARTLLGRGRYWTTAYYVDGLLIDSGCAHTARELEQNLREQPLKMIVNTHSHEDHIGGNGILQSRRAGLRIFAHSLALDILKDPKEKQPLQLYRKLFWGWPEPSEALQISDGEMITTNNYSFRVIDTPGHSPDHLCIYEPNKGWLFTGDLFVGGRDRALRADYEIWQIIAALRMIAELPLTCMFPGSARVREEPIPHLHAKISYLEDLGNKVLDLHGKGWSPRALVRKLCGAPMFIELLTAGHFSRRQLVLSYIRGANHH